MSVVWAHVSLWEHATDLVWWSYYSHLWIGRTKRSGKLRGICVSSYLGKLFCSILNQRLLEYIVSLNILHKSQIGILPSNRTADHVFTLRTLRDKYVHNHNEKIYACFVDFKEILVKFFRFLQSFVFIGHNDFNRSSDFQAHCDNMRKSTEKKIVTNAIPGVPTVPAAKNIWLGKFLCLYLLLWNTQRVVMSQTRERRIR